MIWNDLKSIKICLQNLIAYKLVGKPVGILNLRTTRLCSILLSADQKIRYLYIYTIYTIHYLPSIYYIYIIIISRQNRYNIVILRIWPADKFAYKLPTNCLQTAFLFHALLLPQGLEGFYTLVGKLSTGTLELSTGFLSCPIIMDEMLSFIWILFFYFFYHFYWLFVLYLLYYP